MKCKSYVAGAAMLAAMSGVAMADNWPDLPIGIKNGFAAQVGETLYTGLGSAGQDVYKLDLGNLEAGWQKVAAFAGPAPSQPAAAVSGGKIYVFSGSGNETEDSKSPVVFDTAYRYDPESDSWERLATTVPVGLLGASAVARSDSSIAIFGGYNKQLFDKYLADITAIDKERDPEAWNKTVQDFMGMKPKDYHWNDLVLLYKPETNDWTDLGRTPFLPNTGAALVDLGADKIALINGEVKPGLRTDMAKTVDFSGEAAEWEELPPLPSGHSGSRQEGVAGAYAGLVGDALIVAGGANFPGARDAADSGNWFAHDGLSKTWNSDVFMLADGQWTLIGQLPEGLAYGASFSLPEGVLIVGGEDGERNARTDVFLLSVENGAVITTQ